MDRKIILISGGTKGLGLEIAKTLSKSHTVIVTTRHDIPNKLPEGVVCKNLDVTSELSWKNLFQELKTEYAQIDILINNAGIDVVCPIEDLAIDDFQRLIETNITGVFLGTKYAITEMKDKHRGLIINIASAAAHLHEPFVSFYTMTKAAVLAFTRSTAKEMIGLNYPIRCFAISPGFVETGLGIEAASKVSANLKKYGIEKSAEEIKSAFLSKTLSKRSAQPSEIASMLAFLATEQCPYINGSEILIDDGLSL